MTEKEEYFKQLLELQKEEENDDLSLKDILLKVQTYWSFLWKKKWIIIICGLLGGGLGLTYSIFKKTNYTATYVFSIEGDSSMSSSFSSIAGMFGLGGSSMGAFSGDNLTELLKSRRLIEKTLLKPIDIPGVNETFFEYYIRVNELRKDCENEKKDDIVSICDVSYPLEQERKTFTRAQDSILLYFSKQFVEKDISVSKVDKQLSFVTLSFTSKDELFSQLFTGALLDEVSSFYIETKTALSRRNINAFQLQADSIRKELDKALTSRAYYADENVNAARQIMGVQMQKKQTDIQIYGAAYAEMVKNIETLKLDLARDTPIIQIIDNPMLPLESDRVGKKKGVVIGGFLGGFLSCLFFIVLLYIQNLKKELKEDDLDEEKIVPQDAQDA